MTGFANVLLFASLAVLVLQRLRTLLTYFQQEEYDGRRFVGSWVSVRLFDCKATLATFVALAAIAAGMPDSLAMVPMAIAYLAIAWGERRYKYKKPLAMTERATRIYRLASAALLLGTALVLLHPAFAILALQLAPLALIAANALLQPMQTRINARFEGEARAKLERLDPLRIGITGSFGKTTVKHMLAEILEASGPVFYSRGSINTVLGLTRYIRQRLQWSHRYFIAEMGAYGIGSIQRLCDFVHPNYGIVTAVGDAHTERFGSIAAIAQAKSELAGDVCKRGGKVVLNADLLSHAPFRAIRESHAEQVVTVGPKGSGADVEIESHEIEGGAWSISLQAPQGQIPAVRYDLPLLGAHNVMNSALAVTMALIIDPGIAGQIPFFTRTIAQVPHRLQKLDAPNGALILDDAYNSNELGFLSAVAAMDKLAGPRGGRRILVTPGIAELGLEHDRVHQRLGAFCSSHCDVIYAVNPRRIASFVDAAKAGPARVIEVATFAEARAAISADGTGEDVILYENDLPDLLEERRLL